MSVCYYNMICEVRKLTSFQTQAYCLQVLQQVKNKRDAP
jgi:hypothetical protein